MSAREHSDPEAELQRALSASSAEQLAALGRWCGKGDAGGVELSVAVAHRDVGRRRVFRRTPEGDADRVEWEGGLAIARQQGGSYVLDYGRPLEDWSGADLEAVLVRIMEAFPAPVKALDEARPADAPVAEWGLAISRQGRTWRNGFSRRNFLGLWATDSGWQARVTLPGPLPVRAIVEWSLSFGAMCDFDFRLGPATRRELLRTVQEPKVSAAETREALSLIIKAARRQLAALDRGGEEEDD